MPRDVPPAPPGSGSLRRHPALVALSRDHHHALVQALALRRAAEPDAPQRANVVRAFLAFADEDLTGHFADEEDVLLPVAQAVAPDETARVRAEHGELRALIAALRESGENGGDVCPLLRDVASLLHDHVRYEERALFERVQEALDATALDALGEALEKHREERGHRASCSRPSDSP